MVIEYSVSYLFGYCHLGGISVDGECIDLWGRFGSIISYLSLDEGFFFQEIGYIFRIYCFK